MDNNQPIELTEEPKIEEPKLRQIVIETDGNMLRLVKNESSGNLELSAILSAILSHLRTKN